MGKDQRAAPLLATSPSGEVRAAYVLAALHLGFVAIQLALAVGAPLGFIAWGGRGGRGVLPDNLRVASGASALVLATFAVLTLSRVGVGARLPSRLTSAAMWFACVQLLLNTVTNALSSNVVERLVLAPVTLLMAVLAFRIAR